MIRQIVSMVQFVRGTAEILDQSGTIIPKKVLIHSLDDGVFKLGNGEDLYKDLDVLFTYEQLKISQNSVSNIFEYPLEEDDNNKIVIIKYNEEEDVYMYGVSDTPLKTFLKDVSTLEDVNETQTASIATIFKLVSQVSETIATASDDELIIINEDNEYVSSGITTIDLQDMLNSAARKFPGSHIISMKLYTDEAMTTEISRLSLKDNVTYYVNIHAINNLSNNELEYALTSNNTNIVITQIEDSLFSIKSNNVTVATENNVPFSLVATVDIAAHTSSTSKSIACVIKASTGVDVITLGIYGDPDTSYEYFNCIYCSSDRYYFAIGMSSNADDEYVGIIVKFDYDLNIVAKKNDITNYNDTYYDTMIGDSNYIYIFSEAYDSDYLTVIIKLDHDLNLIASKVITGMNGRMFDAAIDQYGYLIAVGHIVDYTGGIIIKFNSSLNIELAKVYHGTGSDYFNGVAIDSDNNYIVVGYTTSQGTDYSCLICKFTSLLVPYRKKIYYGDYVDFFNKIYVDKSFDTDRYIAVGISASDNAGTLSMLIVSFNDTLGVLFSKIIGPYDNNNITGITKYDDYYYISGKYGMASGAIRGFISKLDESLVVVKTKYINDGVLANIEDVLIDPKSNVIGVGTISNSGIASSYDNSTILRLPNDWPTGEFIGAELITDVNFGDTTFVTIDTINLIDETATLTLDTLAISTIDFEVTLVADTERSYVVEAIDQ